MCRACQLQAFILLFHCKYDHKCAVVTDKIHICVVSVSTSVFKLYEFHLAWQSPIQVLQTCYNKINHVSSLCVISFCTEVLSIKALKMLQL